MMIIGGFFNRLEASRKYLFGMLSVYGKANDSVIVGAFLVRGQEALPAFDVAPDYESYEFTKLDTSKKEDREFVEDQWEAEKPVVIKGKVYIYFFFRPSPSQSLSSTIILAASLCVVGIIYPFPLI